MKTRTLKTNVVVTVVQNIWRNARALARERERKRTTFLQSWDDRQFRPKREEEKKNLYQQRKREREKKNTEREMFLVLVSSKRPSSLPNANMKSTSMFMSRSVSTRVVERKRPCALAEEFRWELDHTRKRVRKKLPFVFLRSLSPPPSSFKTGARAFDYMLVNKFR